jgi:hypothetical protein
VRREQIEALESHEDRELVNRMLLRAVEDEDNTFDVRQTCAGLLVKRQRLGQLDDALRTGSLHTRGVILRTLSRESFFRTTYVDDPSFRARETVREWLAQQGDLTRSHAIQLAILMGLDDAMPLIRPIVAQPTPPTLHPAARRELIIAAASAVERFRDCESLPQVAALAESDPDHLVRLRCMQSVDRTAFRGGEDAPCPAGIDAARMRALVTRALDDPEHTVRMGAMLILARQADWARGVADRLQAILDGDGSPPERRQALETLAALGQPAFAERFPRYFLDPAFEVRSSALRAATSAKEPWLGCLIALVQAETESELVFSEALRGLREAAGKWIGFEDRMRYKASSDPAGFQKDLATLFARGEVEGHTRQGLVEAWFRWWCERLQLTEEQVPQALAARKACWDAKDRRDVAAARAALDGLGFDVPGLFAYERAWIERNA